MTAWVPVIAAFIAALTASAGYFFTHRVTVLQQRRETYALALLAVESYQELPYRIQRRADDDPATRGALGSVISDCERDLDYYAALMDLDAIALARRFRALVTLVRVKGTEFRDHAWSQSLATGGQSMRFRESYEYDDHHERQACLLEMNHRLKILGFR